MTLRNNYNAYVDEIKELRAKLTRVEAALESCKEQRDRYVTTMFSYPKSEECLEAIEAQNAELEKILNEP